MTTDAAQDPGELIEAYYEQGWTDGLPVVPPSDASVEAMLAAGGFRGDEVIGEIAGRNTEVVADKVAINAVMAGCRPEYLPVVVAALRGLCHPDFAYHGPASSTGGSAMVLIVNGPDRAPPGDQPRQQRLRPGPPSQRHDRPRRAPGHDERDEHAAGISRPRHAGQPRQVHVLLRGDRGRSSVGAAAREPGLRAPATAR